MSAATRSVRGESDGARVSRPRPRTGIRSTGRVPVQLLLVLLLAGHGAWLLRAFGNGFSSPDAPGYLLQARQLATEGTTAIRPRSPAQFVDFQFLDVGDGEFRSRYPPGLPALQALPYRLGGVPAALAVNPLLAVLGGLLLFLLARRWAGPGPALLGVLLYATLPVLNEQALMGMAHVAVTTALLGALLALDCWVERPTIARALLLGALLGTLPALRYPAAIAALAVGTFAALRCARSVEHRRTATAGALGFAVPLLALLAHNTAAYGFPFATGYGLTGENTAFSLHYLKLNAPGYLKSIRTAAGPVALFGAAGILAMFREAGWRRRAVLLVVLIGAPTSLYAAYYWSLTGPRFLVPGFVLAILAAASLFRFLPSRTLRLGAAVALAGWHLAVTAADGIPRMERLGREIQRAETVVDGLRRSVPTGSVVIAPLPVRMLAAPYGEWKLAESSLLWEGQDELVMPPLPDPPPGARRVSPIQPGRAKELRSRFVGLDGTARTAAVLAELVRWAGPDEAVYFLGDPDALSEAALDRSGLGRFVHEGRIELPDSDSPPAGTRSGSSPDLRFWIPRPPLELYRFVPGWH